MSIKEKNMFDIPKNKCSLPKLFGRNSLFRRFPITPSRRRGDDEKFFKPINDNTITLDIQNKPKDDEMNESPKSPKLPKPPIMNNSIKPPKTKKKSIWEIIKELLEKKSKLKKIKIIKNIKIKKKKRNQIPLIQYKRPIILFKRASINQSKFFNRSLLSKN